ncbi:ATP-binding protein [Pseudomonas fluorescens]|uniref:ATP-binding protein n=1 Tax=Pseudomonas fluorescens TaxID=294 RepID=A0A7Z6QRS5_PSEFL|nr:ATP-binding protein [Pseudomonas fluorescens]RDS92597.1 ATP-binding protein [Pseudomonas fluorescens]
MQVMPIPTLNDSPADYIWLFKTLNQVINCTEGTCFTFLYCTNLSPSAIAFIGGLVRLAEHKNIIIRFDWTTLINANVSRELRQNGFAVKFGYTSHGWTSDNSIPYREDAIQEPDQILDYLTDRWIGRDWMRISERLRDSIVGRVWEIYANSFEHGQSPVGVFTCGLHSATRNELILSVVDFGFGIPNKIYDFLQQNPKTSQILPSSLLAWAFKRGNTTGRDGVARGLGLDLLNEFVRLNEGSLEIYSNNAYAIVDKTGQRFQDNDVEFSGTVVQIKLKCDEKYYRFRDEIGS